MTPQTPVTVLSDGAVGPRALGEAASTGPVRHILDWFHLAMRIQHVAQCVKSWPAATAGDQPTLVRLESGDGVTAVVSQRLRESQPA